MKRTGQEILIQHEKKLEEKRIETMGASNVYQNLVIVFVVVDVVGIVAVVFVVMLLVILVRSCFVVNNLVVVKISGVLGSRGYF